MGLGFGVSCLFKTTWRFRGSYKYIISRVISRVTILITHIKGLITLLITTPEPPSTLIEPQSPEAYHILRVKPYHVNFNLAIPIPQSLPREPNTP